MNYYICFELIYNIYLYNIILVSNLLVVFLFRWLFFLSFCNWISLPLLFFFFFLLWCSCFAMKEVMNYEVEIVYEYDTAIDCDVPNDCFLLGECVLDLPLRLKIVDLLGLWGHVPSFAADSSFLTLDLYIL